MVVFDPLAIALILAYNSIVVREERKQKLTFTTNDSETLTIGSSGVASFTGDVTVLEPAVPVEPDDSDPHMPTVDPEVLERIDEGSDDIVPIPPTDPIQNGWSLAGNLPVNYDKLPYFRRPGYDWEARRNEWEKDSYAVEYYENFKKNIDF